MAVSSSQLRIVVLGYIVRGPLGGLMWHYLQYLLGLRDLGHDVIFIEDSNDYPSCYDPTRHVVDVDPSYGLEFASKVFSEFGLEDRWAYFDAHRQQWLGPFADRVTRFCETADVVMNVSGLNPLRPWLENVPLRALIDTDPAFTQVKHLNEADARTLGEKHTCFFTFAENIGRPACYIPDDGFPWIPTRQPLVQSCWPFSIGPAGAPYTTVMQWQSYAPVEFEGRHFGMKGESFESLFKLPAELGVNIEIALGGEGAPSQLLQSHGWHIRNALEISLTPRAYQEYIRESRGELGIAKHGYVTSRSGWFSERSVAYLASGRPVVAQDTGFSVDLPTGEGLFAFTDIADAVAAIIEIESDYAGHCRAASEIAREYFDAKRVLSKLVGQLT